MTPPLPIAPPAGCPAAPQRPASQAGPSRHPLPRPGPDGRPRRCRGDAGQVAGVEVWPLAILLFVGGVLVIANLWASVDATQAVSAAAREGGRSFVEAIEVPAAREAADAAARQALAGYGRSPQRATVEVEAPDGLLRCAPVTVVVRYRVEAVRVPLLGGIGSRTVTGSHTEIIDPYREGSGFEAGGCG